MIQGFSNVNVGGNLVPQVSLLPPSASPQSAPKVIGGAERQQIMLCDPLTGEALDIQGTVRERARNIYVGVPSNGTIDAMRVMFDFTLTDVYTKTTTGDVLVTVYKNGAPLDAGISTSSIENHVTYATRFFAGDQIGVSLTNTSSACSGLEVALGVIRVTV